MGHPVGEEEEEEEVTALDPLLLQFIEVIASLAVLIFTYGFFRCTWLCWWVPARVHFHKGPSGTT